MEFHFKHQYFKKSTLNKQSIHIEVEETPTFDVEEEDYSLKIFMRYFCKKDIQRKTAIEHHKNQKHCDPHLQFKLHCEGVGTIRLTLNLETENEYYDAVLGFIYKTKDILTDLEKISPGITEELLNLEEVNKLEHQGIFLENKIIESLPRVTLERTKDERQSIEQIKENPLLISFLGKENIKEIVSHLKK